MRTLLVLIVATAMSPASAEAATVAVSGSTAEFTAARGEANLVAAIVGKDGMTITDDGARLNAGPGCNAVDEHAVTCAGATLFAARLGDRDDQVAGTPSGDRLDGGPGNDQLQGYGGGDVLRGGPGDDGLGDAGRGGSRVLCGRGDDTYSGYQLPWRGRRVDLARDCERIAGAWGLLRIDASARRLRLAFPHYGCPVTFRVGGKTATLRGGHPRRAAFAVPAAATDVVAELRCPQRKRSGVAFRLLPATRSRPRPTAIRGPE